MWRNHSRHATLKAEKAGVFQTSQTLCWEEPWLLMLLRDGFQESSRYQESHCCSGSEQEWAELWANFAMLENEHVPWFNVLPVLRIAAISFTSITSVEQRARMQVSSSDNCERRILFTVSIFAKGQINKGCLLGNVESWKSWSFPDTSNLVWGRFFGCWCYCVTASRNLVAARNHVACSSSSKNEQNIEQICVFWKNKHLP